MDGWFILQIILDIYLCGFIIYYIFHTEEKNMLFFRDSICAKLLKQKKLTKRSKDFWKTPKASHSR